MHSVGTPLHWIGFLVLVLLLLGLDLFVFHRKTHEIRVKEALGWSAFWIALSLAFNAFVFVSLGSRAGLEFLTGYVVEKALSVDNLFVFLIIFGYFKVPKEFQHRVLFWGILGALVLRAVFILSGTALIQRFHFVMYIFGAFLVYTGGKLLFQDDDEMDPDQSRVLAILRRVIPSTSSYRGAAFFVREGGRRVATPLLIVLLLIEATDVVFAVDSIPAIFAITQDPFLVFSSNIFAILGLRSLYFALAAMMDKFHYLKVGLAFVLSFVGAKMLLVEFYKVPIGISLGVILFLLVGSVVASFLYPPAKAVEERADLSD